MYADRGWSKAVAEAVQEQSPDVRDLLLDSIRDHGLEFVIEGDDRLVFMTNGLRFCAITVERRPLSPMSSRPQ